MSRSLQQSDELFLPAASHPRRDSFFDYPSSPTYLYDEESGTFKTVWPPKSKAPKPRQVLRETEWDDVRPPSPLRTPPRKQHYQPPSQNHQQEAKEIGYFDDEAYPKEEPGYWYDVHNQQPLPPPPGPTAAAVHLRSDHEIGRALSPPNRARVALYDKPIDDYENYDRETGVDADGVSEASFSGPESRDDRLHLPSSRDPVSPPRLDTSKARLWATPRRDVGIEAPIVVQAEEAIVQNVEDSNFQGECGPYYRQRVFSDPGTGYGRVNPALGPGPEQHYQREREPGQEDQRPWLVPDLRREQTLQVDVMQEFHQREPEHLLRPRVFTDPGAGSHWERRRDLAIGRSSMPSGGSFDDDSSSSFRVLNVQRVPVGSLEMRMSRPSKDDNKKLRVWKRLKGFVS